MTHTPRKGVSPNWSNLPKRKCDNCGTIYRPARPLRADQKYGFCNRDCNKQFYKHGAAFIQIKQAMEKELGKRLAPVLAEVKELRALWSETESRYVALAQRLDPAPRIVGMNNPAVERRILDQYLPGGGVGIGMRRRRNRRAS